MTTFRDEPFLGETCLSTSITPFSNYRNQLGLYADELIRLDSVSQDPSKEFNSTDVLKASEKVESSSEGWGLNTWLLNFNKMCSSFCLRTNAYAALVSPAKYPNPEDISNGDDNLSPAKDLNAEVIFYHETPIKPMGISAGRGSSGESSLLDHRTNGGAAIKQRNWFSFYSEHG
jgi:hypothetical protein